MYKARKKRVVVIGSLLVLLLMITVGYAAFQTQLDVKGSGRITSVWDVRITNVTSGTATGSAENASTPTWTDLTAYMEANLYAKGDAMEYDVTVSNRGTLDAQISDVISTPSNSEAVIITYSGFAKGETIAKGEDKVIHVKIEYNPNYDGPSTSGTSTLEVITQQPSTPQTTTYLLTYDYLTNGGISSNAVSEYVQDGATVDLSSKVSAKTGYTFVGWNTNRNATTGLNNVVVSSNTTLYAIFSKTVTVSYETGVNVSSIGKESDTCTMYNNATTCNVTLPTITVETSGYEADGWHDENTKVGNAGSTFAVGNDIALTAEAKASSYTVTYNYNGATGGNTDGSKQVTYLGKYGTLPSPTKSYTVTYNYNGATSGNSLTSENATYTFDGWYKETDFTNSVTSNSTYNLTSNSIIYAKWTGGSITLPSPLKANNALDGWYSDSGFNTKVGDAGDSYAPTANTNLYAKWVPDSITLSLSTTKTSTTITVIADAEALSGVADYEFSIDGGTTWERTTGGTAPNVHTFNGLNPGTQYTITVRATSNSGLDTTETATETTYSISRPEFTENTPGKVTISYPTGCSSPYVCTYTLNNGTPVTVTQDTTLTLGEDSEIYAEVTIGEVSADSTYNFKKTDLYVSSTGSDVDGVGYGTLAEPYATLSHAYSKATTSSQTSTIYVMDNITQPDTTEMSSNKSIAITSCNNVGTTGSSINNTVTRSTSLTSPMIDYTTGSLSLSNITFDGNGSNVTATDSMIVHSQNLTIDSGTNLQNAVNSGNGGAIFTAGTATLNISGGTISNNTALNGGGIYTDPNTTFNLNSGTINHNSSTTDGGGIYGQGIINISGGNITDNSATSGGGILGQSSLTMTGGAISNNTANDFGGGIYLIGNGTMEGGTISYNTANAFGGGMYIAKTTNIVNGIIDHNSAYYGGGIFNADGGTLTITDVTVSNNEAVINGSNNEAHGGGIYNVDTAVINGGTYESNVSHNFGGAIFNDGNMTVNDATIIKNRTPSGSGAGIYTSSSGSVLNFNGGVIGGSSDNKNVAGAHGGGIKSYNGGQLNITGGTISYNEATQTGGGVASEGPTSITGGNITNNKATEYGGGLRILIDTTTTIGGTVNIQNNTSDAASITNNVDNYGTLTDQKASLSSTDDWYYIKSAKNTNYVLDVANGTNNNDANVDIYSKGSSTSAKFKWRLNPTLVLNGVVYYHLRTAVGDRYAQVATSGTPASGDNVGIWTYRTDTDFYWYMTKQATGVYYIKNRSGSLCLDIQSGTMANSQNVQVYKCNNSEAQRWKFVKS